MGLTAYSTGSLNLNANTLALLNTINRIRQAQALSLTRLSTGLRINRAADDPAGMIAIQSLDVELTAINAAINNSQRADAMMNVAEGALEEVSNLLLEVQSLAVASSSSGGLSQSEIAANQSQIDQAIESIDRIVRTTSFNGQRLLDGSLSIRTSISSGSDNISDLHVHSRPSSQSNASMSVSVTTAATKSIVEDYATTSASTATTISITGTEGTAAIEIAAGANLSAVAASINAVTAETGVVASTTANNSALHLSSQSHGSDAFVTVQHISGDSTNYADQSQASGTDATVTVNGMSTTSDGLEVYFSANGTSATFNLTETGNEAGKTAVISLSGGGATFHLGTDLNSRTTIGIDASLSHALGSSSLGYLSSLKSGGANSLASNPTSAAAIAREASSQVAMTRGRVGAFQAYQVETSVNMLTTTQEALTSARGQIADIDYAAETAELNRQNILLQASIALLGIMNNQASQVLSLLRF